MNIIDALHNEYRSAQIYHNASSLYHSSFAPILKFKEDHIKTLSECLNDENDVYQTQDDDDVVLSGDLTEDLAFLIAHENENIAFYNTLIAEETDIKTKDMFYLFQAHSYNEILPALQSVNALKAHHIFDEIDKGKEFFNEASQTLNKLQNKELSQAELENFLRKFNFSLLGGALLGATAMFMFNELTNQHIKD